MIDGGETNDDNSMSQFVGVTDVVGSRSRRVGSYV